MKENRGNAGVVRFAGDVNSWPGSVGVMRPDHCPKCKCPAFGGDGGINVQGHGLGRRGQRGPPAPEEPAGNWNFRIRRYRCELCGAVIQVEPSSSTARKHFSGAAIAMALALWGLVRRSAAEVRKVVNDRSTDGVAGWTSLRRWAQGITDGTLFPELGLCGVKGLLRERVLGSIATERIWVDLSGARPSRTPRFPSWRK